MKKKLFCSFFIILFVSGCISVAFAIMRSDSYRIATSVLSGGGAAMSSENFKVKSTLGQPSPLMLPDSPPGSENFSLSPGFWYTIDVDQSGELTIVMNLPEGWSMISLPVLPDRTSIQELFTRAIVIYGFERGSGYLRVTDEEDLEIGTGYWILLNKAGVFIMTGQPVYGYTLSVDEPGWNMIGGCTNPSMAFIDNGNIRVIYGYVPGSGYIRILESENLKPCEGYWILLSDIIGQAQLRIKGECNPGAL